MPRKHPTYGESLECIVAEAQATTGSRVEYEVYLDHALDWLDRGEANSVHAVVTDPPTACSSTRPSSSRR